MSKACNNCGSTSSILIKMDKEFYVCHDCYEAMQDELAEPV